MTLHYHLLLSTLDITELPNKPISAAGKPGLQHYTPLLDAEYLIYRKVMSGDVPDEVSVDLFTGAYSPIVGVAAMLDFMQRSGTEVKVHIYSIGLEHEPRNNLKPFEKLPTSFTTCPVPPREIHTEVSAPPQPLTHMDRRSLNFMIDKIMDKLTAEPSDRHIIAECLPGGTTTANVLLNLLLGIDTTTASSSTDSEVVKNKNDLVTNYTNLIRKYNIQPQYFDWFGDYVQHVVRGIAQRLSDEPPPMHRVMFGGGCQMLAPLLAADVSIEEAQRRIELVTTPWVMKVAPVLQRTKIPTSFLDGFNLRQSQRPQWKLYEEGFAKEGCGFGAVLYTAQRLHNLSNGDLVKVLDQFEV